ncbi:chemotaxis protein CheD [Halobacteriales archaeon QS_1_68_17]|nr:MAG: chemotaxis protein CheD [Halobacteriales archaeon QS_1_68_17]
MKVYDGDTNPAGDPDVKSDTQIKVGIAEYEVTANGATLTTSGLGSCLGVAVYDEAACVGGLIHVMLPSAEEMTDANRAKFADTGLAALIETLEREGASRERMVAKMAGGSDMLDFSRNGTSIGSRNVEQVEETLAEFDIPIVGRDIGGEHGRSVRFRAGSGDMEIKSASEDATTI